jgi:putative nucleotidyltransferase with HDIG domain
VVLLTGEPNVDTAAEAVRLGAFDYLSKPVSIGALLAVVAKGARAKKQYDVNVRLTEENENYRRNLEALVVTRTAELSDALRGTIGVVAQTMETRDPYTAGHQRSVARLALALAAELSLPAIVREGIEMAALVHDLGKIAVPAEILSKPTRLSALEFSLVKEHAQVGYEILRGVKFPWPIADIVIQHHERLDGSGYPAGLVGDAIRLEARIIGVADVVEAMASHRPYRAALGIEAALEEITQNCGRCYDPDVVEACLQLFREKGHTLAD